MFADKYALQDNNNNYYATISMKKAKDMARMAGLDLVCFNAPESTTMALCKIIDYGKWKYSQEKKKKKEQQTKLELKELRFTPVISDNDLNHKVKQIIGFLQNGHEVMVVMKFKGIHHRLVAEGEVVVGKIVDMSKDVGKIVTRKRTNDNITIRLAKV